MTDTRIHDLVSRSYFRVSKSVTEALNFARFSPDEAKECYYIVRNADRKLRAAKVDLDRENYDGCIDMLVAASSHLGRYCECVSRSRMNTSMKSTMNKICSTNECEMDGIVFGGNVFGRGRRS